MSGEFAYVHTNQYCHSAVMEVGYVMQREATEATSLLVANFLVNVGGNLVHQIAYSEAGDTSVKAEDMLLDIDRLIAELQIMREKVVDVINRGNDASLLKGVDNADGN